MSTASAEAVALAVTRDDYALGQIDIAELDDRVATIIGLHGQAEREWALETTEYVNVTRFGDTAPQQLATRWRWPSDLRNIR